MHVARTIITNRPYRVGDHDFIVFFFNGEDIMDKQGFDLIKIPIMTDQGANRERGLPHVILTRAGTTRIALPIFRRPIRIWTFILPMSLLPALPAPAVCRNLRTTFWAWRSMRCRRWCGCLPLVELLRVRVVAPVLLLLLPLLLRVDVLAVHDLHLARRDAGHIVLDDGVCRHLDVRRRLVILDLVDARRAPVTFTVAFPAISVSCARRLCLQGFRKLRSHRTVDLLAVPRQACRRQQVLDLSFSKTCLLGDQEALEFWWQRCRQLRVQLGELPVILHHEVLHRRAAVALALDHGVHEDRPELVLLLVQELRVELVHEVLVPLLAVQDAPVQQL